MEGKGVQGMWYIYQLVIWAGGGGGGGGGWSSPGCGRPVMQSLKD